jgi:hypothetical protein
VSRELVVGMSEMAMLESCTMLKEDVQMSRFHCRALADRVLSREGSGHELTIANSDYSSSLAAPYTIVAEIVQGASQGVHNHRNGREGSLAFPFPVGGKL